MNKDKWTCGCPVTAKQREAAEQCGSVLLGVIRCPACRDEPQVTALQAENYRLVKAAFGGFDLKVCP